MTHIAAVSVSQFDWIVTMGQVIWKMVRSIGWMSFLIFHITQPVVLHVSLYFAWQHAELVEKRQWRGKYVHL